MIQGRLEQVSKQNKKNIIALLTGKGNNTLKSKNMLNILGHPVLFYPANEAKKSLLINDFFCSSENSDILTEAFHIGYKKIVRPIELAQADSQHEDVIFHALNIMESIGNIPDILVVILANNVSIKVEWIDLCIKKILDDENISAVVPIYADNDHHPLRCKCIVNNRLQPYFQESANNVSSNRQDLPKCYFLAHNFWVINVGLMLKNRGSGQPPWKFMGNNIDYIIIDDSVDIHKESDVLLAENWLKNNHY
ncbi:MAG: CMP-N-acetylneuraminic acid synthetase [Clostridia bacterium]|nr:CMP-N-acetylneuraminic acid synthetase [Clostridia bacterium]